jgi:hypothetical protein
VTVGDALGLGHKNADREKKIGAQLGPDNAMLALPHAPGSLDLKLRLRDSRDVNPETIEMVNVVRSESSLAEGLGD